MNKLWSTNRVFLHVFRAPTTSLLEVTQTQEIEEPYRNGTCLVTRIPYINLSIAIGLWKTTQPEDQALLSAVGGRIIGDIDALEKEEQNVSSPTA